MARSGATYSIYNGTKIEVSKDNGTSYTQIHGITDIPDIGGDPNQVDTTDLDNEKYETSQDGLIPAPKYDLDMNMEDPDAEANINIVSELEDSKRIYPFKITYSNGITVSFESKVSTTIKSGKSGDLIKFTMHLKPSTEPERKIPSKSA